MDSLDDVCNSFHSCHGFAVHFVYSFHCSVLGCLGTFGMSWNVFGMSWNVMHLI